MGSDFNLGSDPECLDFGGVGASLGALLQHGEPDAVAQHRLLQQPGSDISSSYVSVYICICTCRYRHIYICMYVYVYECIYRYIHMSLHIYIYTYAHITYRKVHMGRVCRVCSGLHVDEATVPGP